MRADHRFFIADREDCFVAGRRLVSKIFSMGMKN